MAKFLDNQSPHYEEVLGTAGADIAAGTMVALNEINVFPMVDVDFSENPQYAGVVKSPKVLAAKAVGAITTGQALYYVVANNNVTTTAGANILIGFANKPALSGDTHVDMRYDGTLAFAKL